MDVRYFPLDSFSFDDVFIIKGIKRKALKKLFKTILNDKLYVYHIVRDGDYNGKHNKIRYHIEYDAVKDRKRKIEKVLEDEDGNL